MTLAYQGLDGVLRETQIESSRTPSTITRDLMRIPINLEPQEQTSFALKVVCKSGQETIAISVQEAADRLAARGAELAEVEIYSSNEQFNEWVNRSVADLKMLVTPTQEGLYPYAGFLGSAPSSAEMELLRLWSACGFARPLQKVCFRCWPLFSRRRSILIRTRSRAKSFTKRAKARWHGSERFRSDAITAVSIQPRYSSCSPQPTSSAPATRILSDAFGPISKMP